MKKFPLTSFLKYTVISSTLVLFTGISIVNADSGDLALDPGSIHFSKNVFIEGQKIRIYATAINSTAKDLYGIIKFYNSSGKQIGTDQPISVFTGKTDDVFVDWYPGAGKEAIKVELIPFDPEGDVRGNNFAEKTVVVEADFDRDGQPDGTDEDDDNDGVSDRDDAFPKNKNEQKDSDGDGKGDNEDPDDDNDGAEDKDDALPLDPNETQDSDKDGIGDRADPDDDNDGLYDGEEIAKGTDPIKADTDGDKTVDGKDAFPLNPTEQKDTDRDGVGNNTDTDDDNDRIPDAEDKFSTNIPPIVQKTGGSILVEPGKEIMFDASVSTDSDGKIAKISWKFDDEPEKEGIITRHTFAKSGKHTIIVKATDDAGESVERTYTVYAARKGNVTIGAILLLLLALAISSATKWQKNRKKSFTK